MVDVITRIVIKRPRKVVAGYAANPDNALEWYENIKYVFYDEKSKSKRPQKTKKHFRG